MDAIVIGGRGQPFFELSPYHYCTFKADGKKWRTLVHYWMAACYTDAEIRESIRNADTPLKAIQAARRLGFLDFDMTPPESFLNGLQALYGQNGTLRDVLLSTGSHTLSLQGNHGFLCEGNRYGRILMRVREIYQSREGH